MLPKEFFSQPVALEQIVKDRGQHQGADAVEAHEHDGVGEAGDSSGMPEKGRIGDSQDARCQCLILGQQLIDFLGGSTGVGELLDDQIGNLGHGGKIPGRPDDSCQQRVFVHSLAPLPRLQSARSVIAP